MGRAGAPVLINRTSFAWAAKPVMERRWTGDLGVLLTHGASPCIGDSCSTRPELTPSQAQVNNYSVSHYRYSRVTSTTRRAFFYWGSNDVSSTEAVCANISMQVSTPVSILGVFLCETTKFDTMVRIVEINFCTELQLAKKMWIDRQNV